MGAAEYYYRPILCESKDELVVIKWNNFHNSGVIRILVKLLKALSVDENEITLREQ
jgi:hypothetical protein